MMPRHKAYILTSVYRPFARSLVDLIVETLAYPIIHFKLKLNRSPTTLVPAQLRSHAIFVFFNYFLFYFIRFVPLGMSV